MNHLSMEQLVSLRGPGTEPGTAEARRHVETCELCRDELDRLHQRVARLKALPSLQPPRDTWPAIRHGTSRACTVQQLHANSTVINIL